MKKYSLVIIAFVMATEQYSEHQQKTRKVFFILHKWPEVIKNQTIAFC